MCKTKKQKETGEIYSEYYYYGTVTPSRGKRRCARNAADDATTKKEKIDNNEVPGEDHKAVSRSHSEEEGKTGAEKARKLVRYRSLDSLPEAEP